MKNYDKIRKELTDEQVDLIEQFLAVMFSPTIGKEISKHFGTDDLEEMWMLFKAIVNENKSAETLKDWNMATTWPSSSVWNDFTVNNNEWDFHYQGFQNNWDQIWQEDEQEEPENSNDT